MNRKSDWSGIRLMFVTLLFILLGVMGHLGNKLDNVMYNQQTIIELQASMLKTGLRIEDELAQMRSELCQPWEQKVKP